MDELIDLLPCPFCGSKAIAIRYENQPATHYAHACQNCGATVDSVPVGGTPSGSVIEFSNPDATLRRNTRAARKGEPHGTE